MANDALEMLIKFYNLQAGTGFRAGNENNQEWARQLLETQGDVGAAKNYIRKYVSENPELAKETAGFRECLTMSTRPAGAPPTEAQVTTSLGILEQALVKVVAETSAKKIEDEIMGQVQNSVRDFIKSEYGTIERRIITVIDGKKAEMEGVLHEKFDTVLKYVANDEPVFLTGPAGSGKNYLCKQVADALGLKFYFTNAVTQEYKLTGFTDAMGNYQPTQFYKAFTEGGLFMLDEMDASIPEVLVILNAAIANRYFDFPAPIGYVQANPNFRVIAAGNTIGHGADFEYVGRNQLDAASLDRFATVRIDYSKTIEDAMACDDELADFCRDFRNASNKVGLKIIVSYRAISRLAKMVRIMDLREALDTGLVKGLEKDDLNLICNELHESKYRRALRELAS